MRLEGVESGVCAAATTKVNVRAARTFQRVFATQASGTPNGAKLVILLWLSQAMRPRSSVTCGPSSTPARPQDAGLFMGPLGKVLKYRALEQPSAARCPVKHEWTRRAHLGRARPALQARHQ